MPLDYRELTDAEAEDVVNMASTAPWKQALIDGKVLDMSGRPNWSKADTESFGRMRSRQHMDSAGKRWFYVWLEDTTTDDVLAEAL